MELAGKIVLFCFVLEGGGGVVNKVSNVKYFIDHFTWINGLFSDNIEHPQRGRIYSRAWGHCAHKSALECLR